MIPMNIVNIYENYNYYFNADLKAIFERCSKIASRTNYRLYLIGGIVRDLLLNQCDITEELNSSKEVKPSFYDIDITVEGNAIEFCKVLEKEGYAKIISLHKDFGTAKVEIDGLKLDFASTRCEIYPKKGHLPEVCSIGHSLECDVIRRDFTINSLALSLNEDNFCDLLDYVGGFDDLASKKIRVLHDFSFVDDPTRIIRGLKFAFRFGFEIEGHTHELQKKYLANINYDMGYKRIKSELKQTFSLNSQVVFEKFINDGIYKLLTQKEFELPNEDIEELVRLYKPKHHWIIYLGLLAVYENDDFMDKLELTKYEKDVVLGVKKLLHAKLSDDFEVYKNFEEKHIEALLIYAILKDKQIVFRYLNSLRKIKLLVTGQDLLEMGILPSKVYTEIFDYVLKNKLVNPNLTKEEEIALVKDYMAL